MTITLYSIPELSEEIHRSRWPLFWRTFARTLKISIAFVDSGGRLFSLYNPPYPLTHYQKYPLLMESYETFFNSVPHIFAKQGKEGIIREPLGSFVSLERLEDSTFLIMSASFNEHQGEHPADDGDILSYKVGEGDIFDIHGSPHAPDEMEDYLRRVVELYNMLYRYFCKPDLRMLFKVVENEKLIAMTFVPGLFDLKAVLELICSFLLALTGCQGAFAFSYDRPGQMLTTHFGEHTGLLSTLAGEWRKLGLRQDPSKIFDIQARKNVEKSVGAPFEGIHIRRNDASIYLGLVGKRGSHYRKILAALADKAATALGVSLLSKMSDLERISAANEIAAALAHEVRNPLATAKAAVQLVRIIKDPCKQGELLYTLEHELERMNESLTNFLEGYRPQQQEEKLGSPRKGWNGAQ